MFFIVKLLDCTINVINLGLKYDCIEYLAIDITYHHEITRLIVVYIAPCKYESSAFSTLMAVFITRSCSVNYRCCFLCYLNLPNIDWTNGLYPQSHEYTSICGAFYDCGFHQTVASPTRLNNILDLVLVNDPLIVHKLTFICPLGNSEHNKVEFELIAAIPRDVILD